MKSNRKRFPILWEIKYPEIPNYSVIENLNPVLEIYDNNSIFDDTFKINKGIKYDISRVSSKNARKNELGPYKNSFLREIIVSHKMGKFSGTKEELVNTILTYHEKTLK